MVEVKCLVSRKKIKRFLPGQRDIIEGKALPLHAINPALIALLSITRGDP